MKPLGRGIPLQSQVPTQAPVPTQAVQAPAPSPQVQAPQTPELPAVPSKGLAQRAVQLSQNAAVRGQQLMGGLLRLGPKVGGAVVGALLLGGVAMQGAELVKQRHEASPSTQVVQTERAQAPQAQRPAAEVQRKAPLAVPSAAEQRALSDLARDTEKVVRGFARQDPDAFALALTQIYGDQLDAATRSDWVARAAAGGLPLPGRVVFVAPEVLRGGDAAYSPEGRGTVYLSRTLVGDREKLRDAYLEEVGHHLDHLLGGAAALGDEGLLFRIALLHGRPLTPAELAGGRAQLDHGTIELDGRQIAVEFSSDPITRAYEARDAFRPEELLAAAEDELRQQVDAQLMAGAGVATLEELGRHLEGQGTTLQAARRGAETVVFEGLAGRTLSRAELTEVREQHLGGRADALAREAMAAATLVRLVKAGVLPEGTTLGSALPRDTQARVDSDPFLGSQQPKITTAGQLFLALMGDVNANGRLDMGALELDRLFPRASAQTLLRALQERIEPKEMDEKLRAVGFESALTQGWGAERVLTFDAPQVFGLAGKTEIDRVQQQLLLRTGRVFVDANQDGKVDAGDLVKWVDRAGNIQSTTYGQLDDELKVLVKYNMATTRAVEEYSARPFHEKIRFPHWDAATGRSQPDKTDERFWRVGRAQVNGNQASWELQPGVSPADALNDPLTGNGGKYTTECAQGRTLLRLKGLLDYYVQEHGEGAGSFRFDMIFAKTDRDARTAQDYWRGFERFTQANPGKGWDEYLAATPKPNVEYMLEVSRHHVLGHQEKVIQPWQPARGEVESAGGDTGYFHNYSVSVQGVKIGYVGENVIDLGYVDGIRRYWGHPGGIQTEERWQSELASTRIMVHSMADYGQYFSSRFAAQDALRMSEYRVEGIEGEIRDLQRDKPAGFEATVKDLEQQIGWWKALGEVRAAIAEHVDPDRAEAARRFFQSGPLLRSPEVMKPLVETLTPAGLEKLSAAFGELAEAEQQRLAGLVGKPLAELSPGERAQAAALVTLSGGGGTRLHTHLASEGVAAVTNQEFGKLSAELMGAGGPFSGHQAFGAWLKTDAFTDWYRGKTGGEWGGERDLAKLKLDQVRELVELAFPMVAGKRTIYAEVNRGAQRLSTQMAELLKEGKLPEAEYRLDARPLVPLR